MRDQKVRNMQEFAALSGLSRPTLSKYFNDPKSVRSSTRRRIEEALARHAFKPNIYAVNQNRRLTNNIGIVVPYLADPFFAEIARSIETLCIDAGFRPILLSSHGDPRLEADNLDSLVSLKPAGVLLAPLGRASDRDAVARFCDAVPTVLFDSRIDSTAADFIGSDNAQSMALIVDYLCRTGEPPALFEMRTPVNPNAIKRRVAYVDAMERLGHAPRLLQVPGDGWDFEQIGFAEGRRVIDAGGLGTDTILCSNDRLAIGLMAAAFALGVRVGRSDARLRIAGHDDHPFSRFTCPGLTTVAQDYDRIARHSVSTLLSLVDKGQDTEPRGTVLFAGTLVIRGSA